MLFNDKNHKYTYKYNKPAEDELQSVAVDGSKKGEEERYALHNHEENRTIRFDEQQRKALEKLEEPSIRVTEVSGVAKSWKTLLAQYLLTERGDNKKVLLITASKPLLNYLKENTEVVNEQVKFKTVEELIGKES